ncbi:hypothetical protein OG883_13605 [Streptomyces sp. NBC_01142]|uniref:hypothetical protein n=1 Tax=Streptomyces sp. NBC_01142 TaxID=2975865 RepID=UPI0022512CDA|nr:hypothetical protein [Streptomyces sp. NBC_01142]MCX4820926.1 hypothetical protein [Streptomyces sp. NBC_01142]
MIIHIRRTGGPPSTWRGRARTGIRTTFVSVLLVAAIGACSPGPDTSGGHTADHHSSSDASDSGQGPGPVTTSPDAPPDPPPAVDTVIPESLAGAWESDSEGDDATLAYRFMPDGRYRFIGLMSYAGPAGTVEITHLADGTARVDGNVLLLEPTSVTRTRQDPGDPAGNYTDQPGELTPEARVWEVAGDTLALTGDDGLRLTFQRPST